MKPDKPYPEFPLFAHATRRWAKKIKGKLHYFGRWDDPEGALNEYLDLRDDLHAGRTPDKDRSGLTLRELCNRFIHTKRIKLDNAKLTAATFLDYDRVCRLLIEQFGRTRRVVQLCPSCPRSVASDDLAWNKWRAGQYRLCHSAHASD